MVGELICMGVFNVGLDDMFVYVKSVLIGVSVIILIKDGKLVSFDWLWWVEGKGWNDVNELK